MIEKEDYYLSLSDESLKARYIFDFETQETFKGLGQDLSEDLYFMRIELRKRNLQKLHLLQFSEEKAEIEEMGAPKEFILLLLDCKSKNDAAQVVNRIKHIHTLDPFWEENWFD